MRAWRLSAPGEALELKETPRPEVRAGTVLVRMEAVPLLSYLRTYVAGELAGYLPPKGEFTPGTDGIGVIDEVGPDVWHLRPGQRVVLSPHLVARENVEAPDEVLAGLTAIADTPMLADWADGTLAEYTLAPATAVTPLPSALNDVDSARLAVLSRCIVPFGGLLRGRLAPGETLIVHGATGAYGSAAVHVALAMGAGRVVAAGRNPKNLSPFDALDRVRTVQATGDQETDTAALRTAAGGGAHLALDMIGRATDPTGTLATLHSLYPKGRMVLMGSMTVPLPIPYARVLRSGWELIGNFMYPDDAYLRLLRLVGAGLLDLGVIDYREHPLPDLPAAMAAAEQPGAPLIVMRP